MNVDKSKNLRSRVSHDTRMALGADHRESFPRSCRSVGKDRGIKTFKKSRAQALCSFTEHVLLICFCSKRMIKSKYFIPIPWRTDRFFEIPNRWSININPRLLTTSNIISYL